MRGRLRVAGTIGLCTLGLATGCERLLSIHDPVAGDGPDGGAACGPDRGLPAGSPILLSEVVLTPSEAEMIEIVNTSTAEVDLSTYYLSDSGNYYRLPMDKTVDSTDFIVKFTNGVRIPGHGVMTIAIDTPTAFSGQYMMSPSFSLKDGTMTTIAMNGVPNLTNNGEPIVLFQWDGHCDLVRDVDILLAGIPAGSTNAFPNKSNAQQDGPDPDKLPGQYAVDAGTIHAQPSAPGSPPPMPVLSTKRIALESAGGEAHNGNSNGPDGDDETSEDTSKTWDGTAANPFTAPTPGTVPPQLLP